MRKITFEDLQKKNAKEDGWKGVELETGNDGGQTYFELEVWRENPVPPELVTLAEYMMERLIEEYDLDVDEVLSDEMIAGITLGVSVLDSGASELFMEFYVNDCTDTYFNVKKVIEPDSDIYRTARNYFMVEIAAYLFKDKGVV